LILNHITLEEAGLLDLTGGPISTPSRSRYPTAPIRADVSPGLEAGKPGSFLPTRSTGWARAISTDPRAIWIVASSKEIRPSINVYDVESWLASPTDQQAIRSQLILDRSDSAVGSIPARDFAIKPAGSPRDMPGAT